jgi:hypothetical protein
MTADARTNITSLGRGDELPPCTFSVTDDDVRAYLAATGDRGDYAGMVPPMAVVALALRELQHTLYLPEGSLHTGQEVDHRSAVRAGETLTMRGHVAQRSERQGLVISIIEMEISSGGEPAVTARTTIMAPAGDR